MPPIAKFELEKPKTEAPTTFESRLMAVTSGSDGVNYAITALINDLQRLAAPESDAFFQKLAPMVTGVSRNHIARSRAEVYPLRPSLALQNSVGLADGWFLGKNISNPEKLKILRIACDLKGVTPVQITNHNRIS